MHAQTSGGTNGGSDSAGTNGGSSSSGSNTPAPGYFEGIKNPLRSEYKTVGGLVNGFVEIFSYLVIIFAVILIIYVGFQFVLARGNSEEVKKRKDQLLWLVIGVAVVIGARIIVNVVISTLDASGTVRPEVINQARNALDGR